MMRRGLLAVFIGFAALVATAALAADKSAPPNINQTVAFPGGVVADRDLVYAAIDGFRPLTLDVYQSPPKPKETPRPAIVFIHGGGWATGDARHAASFDNFPATLAALAAKGYVVASVNYRLSGEAHYPAAVQDVKSALRWLRAHTADYDIDTTRMMAWGAEAGGQIAAMVGTSCGVAALEPVADVKSKAPMASDCVQGVIDWYGPTDFASWDADAGRTPEPGATTRLGAYLGCEPADCAAGIVHVASPLSYIESMSPPFLIQQGASDTLVAPAQSRKLYDALQVRHVPSELVIYPDVGQDFTKNGVPDAATNTKAIADMEDFIARTFPPAPPKANSSNGSVKAVNSTKPRSTTPSARSSSRK
jgi:acetyl esterase/lipase